MQSGIMSIEFAIIEELFSLVKAFKALYCFVSSIISADITIHNLSTCPAVEIPQLLSSVSAHRQPARLQTTT